VLSPRERGGLDRHVGRDVRERQAEYSPR
jgi:hypothetical protein